MITGAYGGLGRAVTFACARAGATLVLSGRLQRPLEALYDELVAAGFAEPLIHPIDLAKAETGAFEATAQALAQQFGRLDGLVHLAATLGRVAPLEHQTLDGWMSTYRVNVAAPAALTRACSPLLRASHAASLIFTLDTRGLEPRAYWGEYAASKAALAAVYRGLADEWHNVANLRVSAVVPGAMDSPMRRRAYPAEDPARHPAPESIAPLYVELLTGGSRTLRAEVINARDWLATQKASEGSSAR